MQTDMTEVKTTLVPLGRVPLDRIATHADIAAVVPRLPDHKYVALRDGMNRDGLLTPVEVARIDNALTLVEGHHRHRVAGELGWPDIEAWLLPEITTVEQAQAYTAEVNGNRRQLTVAQDKALAAKAARLREGGMSIRAIAQTIGVPKSTVADLLTQLSGAGQLTQPADVLGQDGKHRRGPGGQGATRRTGLVGQLSQADPVALAVAVKQDSLESAIAEAEEAQSVLTRYLDGLVAMLDKSRLTATAAATA